MAGPDGSTTTAAHGDPYDTAPATHATPTGAQTHGGRVPATTRDDRPTAPSAAVGRTTGTTPALSGRPFGGAAADGDGSTTTTAHADRPTAPMALQGAVGRHALAAYGVAPVSGRAAAGGGAAEAPEASGPAADTGPTAGGGRARLLMLVCAGATGITMADTIAGTLTVSALTPAFTGPGMTEADLQWVMTAYAVPFAALLAAAGRLADLVGRRRLLAIGLGLFSLGAAAAAVSMSFPVLLAARAVQGVGSAAVIPASLGLLLAGVPAHRRPGAIGAWMAASGIGGTAVHAAGGWLLGFHGWRAMFLPSAVIAMLLVYGTLALRRDATATGRLPDPVGAVALFAAIGTAVLAITKGPQWGWSPALAALCGGGLVMLLVAVLRSARHPVPVLAMSLWRTPMFGLAGAVSLLHGLIAFPVLIVTPLFLHRVWGYDLSVAAPAMAPLSAGVLVAGYLSGKLCRRYGPRAVVYTGSLCVAVSCGWVITSVLQPEPRLLTAWLPASVLLGVGVGAMATGASTAGTLSAPPAEYAAAVGGTMTARQIGGAVGTAVAAVLVGRLLMDNALSGYVAVFAGCMIMAGIAGLVAMFISPRFHRERSETAAAQGPDGKAPSRFPAPALPSPAALTTALAPSSALTAPPPSPLPSAVPGTPLAMPLSAPIPGDYEPASFRPGHTEAIPATTVRITGPHLPMPLTPTPPVPEPPPRPRTRRGSATRSQRSKERPHTPKERAQAESELRAAATHFLAAADKLTVPGQALPQYYLPEPAPAEPSLPEPARSEPARSESARSGPARSEPAIATPPVPRPAVPEPSVSEPAASEPAVPEPAVPEPAVAERSARQPSFRRMPYSSGRDFS